MVAIKENELYQEIELFVGKEKIGEAEVEIKGKMLSRLNIFPPYQNKGYGTEVVKLLSEKYGCNEYFAFGGLPVRFWDPPVHAIAPLKIQFMQ